MNKISSQTGAFFLGLRTEVSKSWRMTPTLWGMRERGNWRHRRVSSASTISWGRWRSSCHFRNCQWALSALPWSQIRPRKAGGQFNWISTDFSTGFQAEYRTLSETKHSVEHPVEQSVEIQLNCPPALECYQGSRRQDQHVCRPARVNLNCYENKVSFPKIEPKE